MLQLEPHAVFDAPTHVLEVQLRALQQQLPASHGTERQRLLVLQRTIQQELQERDGSQNIFMQLLPIIQGANPDSWAQHAPTLLSAAATAPPSLKQELEELVRIGQRIQAARHASRDRPDDSGGQGEESPLLTEQPNTGDERSSSSSPAQQQQLQPAPAQAPQPPGVIITPQEAALQAFQAEQRKLRQARRALLRGPAPHAAPVLQPRQAVAPAPPPTVVSSHHLVRTGAAPRSSPTTTDPAAALGNVMHHSVSADHMAAHPVAAVEPGQESTPIDGAETAASLPSALGLAAATEQAPDQLPAPLPALATTAPDDARDAEAGPAPPRHPLLATADSWALQDATLQTPRPACSSASSSAPSFDYRSSNGGDTPRGESQGRRGAAVWSPLPPPPPVAVGPLAVDRWSNWDLADIEGPGAGGGGVAAWARDAGDDPLAQHLAQLTVARPAPIHSSCPVPTAVAPLEPTTASSPEGGGASETQSSMQSPSQSPSPPPAAAFEREGWATSLMGQQQSQEQQAQQMQQTQLVEQQPAPAAGLAPLPGGQQGCAPVAPLPVHPVLAAVSPSDAYAPHFATFNDILTAWSGAPGLGSNPALAAAAAAVAGPGLDMQERFRSLIARIGAWMDALAAQSRGNGQRRHGQGAPVIRYYAVVDDTAHPEVRQVLELALAGRGWAPDPIDQITEPARPEDGVPSATLPSTPCTSRPSTSPSAPGVFVQPRSPLAGRCNLWDLLWSWSPRARPPSAGLLAWQRHNHFPEAKQLTRKDLLARHLQRYRVMHGANPRVGHLFACMPTTYVLPKETGVCLDAFARAAHGVEASVTQPKGLNLWIVKPVGLSRGRGIRLVRNVRELQAAQQECSGAGVIPPSGDPSAVLIMQRYVTNPMLVQGFKFDLRLYVLVTSFQPLEAWLCREGFARFASRPFTLESSAVGDRRVHLTNTAVQQQHQECQDEGQGQGQGQRLGGSRQPQVVPPFLEDARPHGGCKCTLATLRKLLGRCGGMYWEVLWERIADQLTACLFAAQDAIPPCPNAFELFGADVLLDAGGQAWVLELNSSPSMSLGTPLDREVKPRVVRDAIDIVNPLPFDRNALLEALAARTGPAGRGRDRGSGSNSRQSTPSATDRARAATCADLQQILGGGIPRKHGEAAGRPDNWFTRIAPSTTLDRLCKLKRG